VCVCFCFSTCTTNGQLLRLPRTQASEQKETHKAAGEPTAGRLQLQQPLDPNPILAKREIRRRFNSRTSSRRRHHPLTAAQRCSAVRSLCFASLPELGVQEEQPAAPEFELKGQVTHRPFAAASAACQSGLGLWGFLFCSFFLSYRIGCCSRNLE
jgi:hypothetical protein